MHGAPEIAPIWYGYFDGYVWFNGRALVSGTGAWKRRLEPPFLMDRADNWR
jgi:hypothetical protein